MTTLAPTHTPPAHVTVLKTETLAAVLPGPGSGRDKVIVDATLGAGGLTRALLDAGAVVHAFDRDPDCIAAARRWPEAQGPAPRLVLHHRAFSEIPQGLAEHGVTLVDGAVFDIGVSSMQLDQAERGFSFGQSGPLDMRMSQDGPTAADLLNTADETDIADIIYRYGEERQSRRIARAIVAARPLTTTAELAGVVRRALGWRQGAPKDPATRTFQAIRIAVNAELDELAAGLDAAEQVLAPGGRLVVITFHSLEDRIAKTWLRQASGGEPAGSRHLPLAPVASAPVFTRGPAAIRPGEDELAHNPRARSATLRWAERTTAPPRDSATPSIRQGLPR